jgi:hypothetical protein
MRTRFLVGGLIPALLVLAAGCATPTDGDGVASVGGSARPSPTPSLSFLAQGIRYAQCMRQQNVAMPDPSVDANGEVHILGVDKHALDENTFANALRACEPYKPVTPPDLLDQKLASAREYPRCMRAHGVESFPDPDPDGPIRLPEEQTDPDYDQAKAVCDAQARSARPSAGATS